MTNPAITIVIPSLNQGKFLDTAISSALSQDLPVEVFVMDGGSLDNSISVIRKWEPQLSGWRSHPDAGQASAVNEGIDNGTAPYVCWLNSDDFFYKNTLSYLYESLEKELTRPFAYGKCWTVNSRGNKVFPYLTLEFLPTLFANFCTICQPGTLIRRSYWEKVDGLNENLDLAFDYELWWKLYKAGGKPLYVRKFISATRYHRDTKTANNLEQHYQESLDAVKKYYGKVPLKWRYFSYIMKIIRTAS